MESVDQEAEAVEQDEAVSSVCFIEHTNGQFLVTDEAKELLTSVKGKVVVVCVAGPYRTGKSYLLNKLIGNPNGFQVGATVRACTKGIWIWGKPIKREETTYLFLDTEGLGSTEQNLPHDTKIFSLAVLLSSFFILNTQGTINEQALNELELVVNCVNQVRMYDKQSEQEEEIHNTSNLATVFPSFLWVLRDFVLRLTNEDNRPISASEYLESCLAQKSDNRTKNRTREAIKNVFIHRDCRTLVRPVLDEEQLQELSSVPSSQLRPEFLKQLDSLSTMIFASARPKQINGSLVNGPALLGLAEAYTQAMNGGKMPIIFTAWEAVVMTQASQGVESAVVVFVTQMNALCPLQTVVEREVLDDAFLLAEKEAIHNLHTVCVGDEQTNRATELTLVNKLSDIKKERVTENVKLSRALCQQVLEEVWSDEKNAISDSEFTQKVAAARQQYTQRAAGPCKEEMCRVFFEKKLLVFCDELAEKVILLTSQCDELRDKKKEIKELHAEAVRAVEEQSEISERLEGELEDLRQQHSSLVETSRASDLLQGKHLHELTAEKEGLKTQLQHIKIVLAETEKLKQRALTKQQRVKERIVTSTTELQSEREKTSVLTHKHQELLLEQQQHKQQLEVMEASCRAVTAESLKHQTLASSAHSQERLQLATSLEAQVTLAHQQHDQLTKLQEQVSRLENEKSQREEAAATEASLKLRELQMKASSKIRILDSDTFASLFFCFFVVLLSARCGFGPAWLA
jgi:hypothetical protein